MEIQGTPVFERIHNKSDRVIMLRGGTRSSKSYSIMQVIVIWLYTGNIGGQVVPKGTFTVARTTFPALRATVMKDFINYLHEIDIYKYIEHKRTVHEFIFKGRTVSFISTDDEHKLRGRQHTFCWLNEVNDMDYDIFNQVAMRTEKWIYLDCNPSGEPWAKTEIEEKRMQERGDVYLDVSVFTDNPFLPQPMIDEILGLELVDPDLFRIYTKGEWVKLKGQIYNIAELIDEMPPSRRDYYGCDFGYNDPTVLVHVILDKNNIYIDLLVHEEKLLLNDMADAIRSHSPRRVLCDSAEPRTIEELKRRGINARPAKKGPDSVRQRITFIKQHKIHVTKRSVELIEEWKRFKWDTDGDGNIIDKPINKFKHCSDAVSYAISTAMGGRLKLIG